MTVEVSNLRLRDDYAPFNKFYDEVERCKLSLLVRLSTRFPDAKFVFYELLGPYCELEDVEKLLSGLFRKFEIAGHVDDSFNSNPINNRPAVRVDGEIVFIDDAETLGLVIVDRSVEPPTCAYDECFYAFTTPVERELNSDEFAITFAATVENLLESKLVRELRTGEERFVLLKTLRGESLCF